MKQTPFHAVPETPFLIRMILPGFVAMSFGVVLTGMLASAPAFQRQPAAVAGADSDTIQYLRASPPEPPRHPNVLQRATYHIGMFAWDLAHIPPNCGWGAVAANQLQKKHCDEFAAQQWANGSLVVLPFALPGFLLLLALDFFRRTFRIARKRLKTGEKTQLGKVTNPATLPNDVFGWFHCCSAVSVQLPDKRQIKVHVPVTGGAPQPGETIAVVEIGKLMGAPRHLGFVYAPHVAVVRGS